MKFIQLNDIARTVIKADKIIYFAMSRSSYSQLTCIDLRLEDSSEQFCLVYSNQVMRDKDYATILDTALASFS